MKSLFSHAAVLLTGIGIGFLIGVRTNYDDIFQDVKRQLRENDDLAKKVRNNIQKSQMLQEKSMRLHEEVQKKLDSYESENEEIYKA